MHTTVIDSANDPIHGMPDQQLSEWIIHHNGDFSGNMIIVLPNGMWLDTQEEKITVTIPFEILQELVGQKMQSDRISAVEQMTGIEFLEGGRNGS